MKIDDCMKAPGQQRGGNPVLIPGGQNLIDVGITIEAVCESRFDEEGSTESRKFFF
jgi:hypothetical protein